jgi:hypothetical protein
MNAPEHKPILDVATQTTFVLLAEDQPGELVIGTVVAAPPQARASGRLTPELFQKKLPPGVALCDLQARHSSRERYHPQNVAAPDEATRGRIAVTFEVTR